MEPYGKESAMFTIGYERNHYVVYRNEAFYCSADSLHEAEQEIENELEGKQ